MKEIKNIKSKTEKFLSMKKPSQKTLDVVLDIINYCSNLYYEGTESSPLTDEEFDNLYNHYCKFAEPPKAIDTKEKPSKRNKNLIDTEHIFPQLVGTLDKTNFVTRKDKENYGNTDANTAEEWFLKLMNSNRIKGIKDYKAFISWKLDGNSITIVYNDKREVVLALTRGKNGLGSDKTEYFKDRKLPECIPIEKGDTIGIKYEAITTFDNKEKIEEIIGRIYASPCSLVSGLLGSKDFNKEAIDLIDLAPIRIQYKNNKITREQELHLIYNLYKKTKEFNICINPYISDNEIVLTKNKPLLNVDIISGIPAKLLDSIDSRYQEFIKMRDNLPYPVDGLVFEFIDPDTRESLGRAEDRNNFEFALKFPYSVKKSVVEDIEFYVSTNGTGRITPVVKFKKVKFSRAECDHVSIANYDRFKKLKLSVGDEVIIEYRNDVLSYLTVDETCKRKNKPIKFITRCPMCGEKLKLNKNKTFVHCINKKCSAIKIGRFNNYLIKLGVDSVRENILTDLFNAGLLTSLASLYKLKVSDIAKIEGYQKKSAENIIESINAKKEVFDYELLGALGFKNISTATCKEICKKFTIKEMNKIIEDEFDDLTLHLQDVNGVASITANQFVKDFKRNQKTISNLSKYLDIKEIKNTIKITDKPESIVFTGFRDQELQKKLEACGHSIKSGVSKKTTMLVTSEKGSGSVKEKKALEYDIPIYSINEFLTDILPSLTE